MTPHALAKAQCANHVKGACLGISVADLAQEERPKTAGPPDEYSIIADPQPVCLLAQDPPEACGYLERVCLILADRPSPKSDPVRQRRYVQARELYREMFDGGKPTRRCRDCGGSMPKGAAACKRYCVPCADKRKMAARRKATRECMRRLRARTGERVHKNVLASPHSMRV